MENHDSPEAVAKRASQEDPIIMYLIVRESINMSIGKTGAQCAHAAQMVILKYFDERKYYDFVMNVPITTDPNTGILIQDIAKTNQHHLFKLWLESSFRKVVLKADDKEWDKLKEIINYDSRVIVVDAGLTELEPGTETIMGLFPMKKSEVPKVVKRLQVLK